MTNKPTLVRGDKVLDRGQPTFPFNYVQGGVLKCP